MNFIKLGSVLMRNAQSIVKIGRTVENYPRDKFGSTIIPPQSRERLLKALRECAESIDKTSIAVDAQHKVALEEREL